MLELRFISDPGHGWLEVNMSLLYQLDLATKISSYSYCYKHYVYLEEDCDASLLIDALKKAGIEYKINHVYQENTPIRHYQSYHLTNEEG
jgi:hypothetical protein